MPGALPDAFYTAEGDGRYVPTRATESPWDPAAQHGGPPTALLAHAIAELDPTPGFRLARITVEFLGVIPREPVSVQAAWVRPGRRIRLAEASLSAGGRPVALARAWQIAVDAGAQVPVAPPADPPPPVGAEATQQWFDGLQGGWGYGEAIDWRWSLGDFGTVGPGAVWTRARVPLVAGRPPDPLDQALLVADSANGVSAQLPLTDWLFVPTSITVTLHREPVGDWVFLEAETTLAADGLGSTLGRLADEGGTIGTVTQPLLVARRPPHREG